MKIRYYTNKEIEKLKNNIFVKDIHLKRRIEYEVIFKLWCCMMRLDLPELTGKQIFERAGFDTSILHNDLPHKRINSWLKNYEKYGLDYFMPEIQAYCSLTKDSKETNEEDKLKNKIFKFVVKRLKEIEDEKNR